MVKQSQNKKGRKFVLAASKMVIFYSWQLRKKDTIFGAAETNFRPFLFWQGFSGRKVTRIVCFGWYDCYCMYIIVIGFSKYTSRYLSDFTKYFFERLSVQIRQRLIFYFSTLFLQTMMTRILESQNSKYLGAKKLGKSVYITAQNKRNWVWKQIKMKVLWTTV